MKKEIQLMMMLLLHLSPIMYAVFKFGDIVHKHKINSQTRPQLIFPHYALYQLVQKIQPGPNMYAAMRVSSPASHLKRCQEDRRCEFVAITKHSI